MATQSETRQARALVLAFVALSALLRFYAISRSSYWHDELKSLQFAHAPTWKSIFWDNTPFLYHLILKIWVALFGPAEWVVRGLSAAFSAAATGFVVAAAYELKGWKAAVAAGLFHCCSGPSILSGQEARMYALFELAAAANLYFLFRYLRGSRRGSWIGLAVSAVAMALTHYLAIVPLTVEIGVLILLGTGAGRIRVGIALAALLAMTAVYATTVRWWALDWQSSLFAMSAQFRWPDRLVPGLFAADPDRAVGVMAAFAVTVLAALVLATERRPHAILAALVVLPILAVTAVGWAVERYFLLPRYFIYVVPPLALWAGLASAELLERYSRKSAVVLLAAGSLALLAALPAAYQPDKEDWRSAADIAARTPGGVVLSNLHEMLAYPYFESRGVKLEDWSAKSGGVDFISLEKLVQRSPAVWLVENGDHADYLPEVEFWARSAGFRVHDRIIGAERNHLYLVELVQK